MFLCMHRHAQYIFKFWFLNWENPCRLHKPEKQNSLIWMKSYGFSSPQKLYLLRYLKRKTLTLLFQWLYFSIIFFSWQTALKASFWSKCTHGNPIYILLFFLCYQANSLFIFIQRCKWLLLKPQSPWKTI